MRYFRLKCKFVQYPLYERKVVCCKSIALMAMESSNKFLVEAQTSPSKTFLIRFYFHHNFRDAGERFIAIATPKWTPFLLGRMGLNALFFERPAYPHEKDVFPNGHPWAWQYKTLEELVKDEAQWGCESLLRQMSERAAEIKNSVLERVRLAQDAAVVV